MQSRYGKFPNLTRTQFDRWAEGRIPVSFKRWEEKGTGYEWRDAVWFCPALYMNIVVHHESVVHKKGQPYFVELSPGYAGKDGLMGGGGFSSGPIVKIEARDLKHAMKLAKQVRDNPIKAIVDQHGDLDKIFHALKDGM